MRALHARLKRDSASAKASGRRGGRRETDREEYVREIYFGGSLRGRFLDSQGEDSFSRLLLLLLPLIPLLLLLLLLLQILLGGDKRHRSQSP